MVNLLKRCRLAMIITLIFLITACARSLPSEDILVDLEVTETPFVEMTPTVSSAEQEETQPAATSQWAVEDVTEPETIMVAEKIVNEYQVQIDGINYSHILSDDSYWSKCFIKPGQVLSVQSEVPFG